MGERTLNFGTDATEADYQVRDSSSTGGDLIIEHLPTGATFEYDATENAWIPTDPIGTANRKASSITTTSVNTDSLIIGGTLYEEDDNSPIDVSNVTSTTFTMAESADEVIIVPNRLAAFGMDGLQVNGDTGNNYDNIDNSATETTGESEFVVGGTLESYRYISLYDAAGNSITYYGERGRLQSAKFRGENSNISGPITQFTLKRNDGQTRNAEARVYRRVMNI